MACHVFDLLDSFVSVIRLSRKLLTASIIYVVSCNTANPYRTTTSDISQIISFFLTWVSSSDFFTAIRPSSRILVFIIEWPCASRLFSYYISFAETQNYFIRANVAFFSLSFFLLNKFTSSSQTLHGRLLYDELNSKQRFCNEHRRVVQREPS